MRIHKANDIVLENRQLKMSEIAKAVGISQEGVSYSFRGVRFEKTICKMGAAFLDNRL